VKKQKVILSLAVMFSLVLISANFVSADNGVDFTSPVAYQNVSGVLDVTWNNTESIPGLTLQYKIGAGSWIDLTTISGSSPRYYSWNTMVVEDGNYYLRLQSVVTTYANITEGFTIDNTKPTPRFTIAGTTIVGETLTFNASSSTDSETGIEVYDWDFGDGSEDDGEDAIHVYSSEGDYSVVLTTTDFAGNTNSTTAQVSISEIEYEESEISLIGVVEGIKNISSTWNTGLDDVSCTSITTGLPLEIMVGNSSSNCTINWANILFAEIGGYDISIRADNGTSVKWYRADLTVYTWMTPLYESQRNFISVPYSLEDNDYKIAFEGIKETLNKAWGYVYNEETGENAWVWMTGGTSWSRSTGFDGWNGEVVPGRGYIVFVDQNTTLYGNAKGISSNPDDTPVTPASVKLANGYNLIGMFGNSTTDVSVALESLKSLASQKYWNKVLDKNEATVADNSSMQPNIAYWVSMKHLPDTATDDYYTYYI